MKRVVLIGLVVLGVTAPTAQAGPVCSKPCWAKLKAGDGVQRWKSPQRWAGYIAIEPDLWIGRKRLRWKVHANGCGATFTRSKALAVVTFCGNHLRVKYTSTRPLRLRYVARV